MKTKRNVLQLYIFAFIALSCFTTCKKYPENYLWFKRPSKILARGENDPWKLEFYSVNNVDSTYSDFLNVYKNEGLIIPLAAKKHTEQKYHVSTTILGFWEYSNHKKNIHFKFSNENFLSNNGLYSNQRNIFLESGLKWEINKLTKNQFWISSNYNNFTYEIHFK